MPLVGTRNFASLAAEAPLVPSLDTQPLELANASVLQVLYEIDAGGMVELIPPALHPTIPPTLFINVTSVPESPWGAFALAEVRAGCRQGARPRAMAVRTICNSEAAAAALAAGWGFPCVLGEVTLERGYDRAHAVVSTRADGVVLEASLRNPDPIGGGDIQYISSLHLARVVRDGEEKVRLVQVDPDFAVSKADRGRPELPVCRPGAFGFDGATLTHAVSASHTTVNITLPTLRYLVDPAKSPLTAVERV
jgi:hypothetical protein